MIYAMHGAVNDYVKDQFVYRNMVNDKAFVRWLQTLPAPLVSLTEALTLGGDALTIDDGTCAAAYAVEIALAQGHRATIFVNPYHTMSGDHYFFSRLNAALDYCKLDLVEWRSQVYDLRQSAGRRKLRAAVKVEWRSLPSEPLRKEFMKNCLNLISQDLIDPPQHLRTLDLKMLIRLKELGADIENHGWTHGEYSALQPIEILQEVRTGADWIDDNVGKRPKFFAVPFGETLPPRGVDPAWRMWVL